MMGEDERGVEEYGRLGGDAGRGGDVEAWQGSEGGAEGGGKEVRKVGERCEEGQQQNVH